MPLLTQKTIKNAVSFQGVGLHSGKTVNLCLKSSEPDTGIIFKRIDLKNNNLIYPNFDNVSNTSLNVISLLILIILIGELLTFKPATTILSINSFAEPSNIGTSSLSISIKALSIPKPNSAPIKCSIVETFTPCSLEIVVFKDVLLTFEKFGITKLLLLRSTLLKIIPVLGSDGLIVTFTNWPL